MTASKVQDIGYFHDEASGTSSQWSGSKSVTSGNYIMVGVAYYASTGTVSATDNLGNTYSFVEQSTSGGNVGAFLYAPVTNAGTLTTLTVTTPAGLYRIVLIEEWTSVGTYSGVGGGTAATSGTTATWVTNKSILASGLAIGFVVDFPYGTGFVAGAASGSPSTSISLGMVFDGTAFSTSSACMAAAPAGGSTVTGFSGTVTIPNENHNAAGAIFNGPAAPGYTPVDPMGEMGFFGQ